MTNTFCFVDSVEAPDDGQWICPKHVEFFIKINLRNSACLWLLLYERIYVACLFDSVLLDCCAGESVLSLFSTKL